MNIRRFSQLQTNERESSATLTTSEGELRLFAYECPDVSFDNQLTISNTLLRFYLYSNSLLIISLNFFMAVSLCA